MKGFKRSLAVALAVLMVSDTVNLSALKVAAAEEKPAVTSDSTVSGDDLQTVDNSASADDDAAEGNGAPVGEYGIATLADTTETSVQVKKSDGTVENYATIYGFTGGNCWANSVVKSSKSDGKITGVGYDGWQGYNDVLHVEGSGASCTIKSGVTIEATEYKPAVYACASLIIEEGVTLRRTNGNEVLRVRPGGNVTIEGGTFQGKVYRISGGTLQISGGTFQNGITVEDGTLADCFNGYGLKKTDGNALVDLTASSVSDSVYVYQIPFWITDQPALADDQASVVEGYTAVPTETTFQIPADLPVGTYRYYCRVTCGSDSIDSDAVTFTVQAGLYGVTVNDTETLYTDLGAALDAIEAAVETATDITFTLRASVTNSAAIRTFSAGNSQFHLTVDLNGHAHGRLLIQSQRLLTVKVQSTKLCLFRRRPATMRR